MNPGPDPHADWTNCPAGTLKSLGGCLRRLQQQRRWRRRAVAVSALLLCALGTWSLSSHLRSRPVHDPDHLSCAFVREILPDYLAGRVAPDLAARIRHHLEVCPPCEVLIHDLEPIPKVASFRDSGDCRTCDDAIARLDPHLPGRFRQQSP